jgi:hypothetical protein
VARDDVTDDVYDAVANADDLTRTWDLFVSIPETFDGRGVTVKMVETLPELLRVLDAPDGDQLAALTRFMGNRVARLMPSALREQVQSYLREQRKQGRTVPS